MILGYIFRFIVWLFWLVCSCWDKGLNVYFEILGKFLSHIETGLLWRVNYWIYQRGKHLTEDLTIPRKSITRSKSGTNIFKENYLYRLFQKLVGQDLIFFKGTLSINQFNASHTLYPIFILVVNHTFAYSLWRLFCMNPVISTCIAFYLVCAPQWCRFYHNEKNG